MSLSLEEAVKCCMCNSDTGQGTDRRSTMITITTVDMNFTFGTPDLMGDHKSYVVCKNPWCRIKLCNLLIEEAEAEIPELRSKPKEDGGLS